MQINFQPLMQLKTYFYIPKKKEEKNAERVPDAYIS